METVRLWLASLLWLLAGASQATATADPHRALASGKADGGVPGWTLEARAPRGWTADCCTYARAIGVDEVLYRGEWTGEPNRVMVLNVWPAKLATLDDELQADARRYHQLDPAGKQQRITLAHAPMPCEANVYQGSDRLDDVVMFCDPGKASGIRLSWSMTLAANEADRRALLDAFMQVVRSTRYRRGYTPPDTPAGS